MGMDDIVGDAISQIEEGIKIYKIDEHKPERRLKIEGIIEFMECFNIECNNLNIMNEEEKLKQWQEFYKRFIEFKIKLKTDIKNFSELKIENINKYFFVELMKDKLKLKTIKRVIKGKISLTDFIKLLNRIKILSDKYELIPKL